jgi:hypothetical protein
MKESGALGSGVVLVSSWTMVGATITGKGWCVGVGGGVGGRAGRPGEGGGIGFTGSYKPLKFSWVSVSLRGGTVVEALPCRQRLARW